MIEKRLAKILRTIFKDAKKFNKDFVINVSPSIGICLREDHVMIWYTLVRFKDLIPLRKNANLPPCTVFDSFSPIISEISRCKILDYDGKSLKEVLKWILSRI